MRASNLERAAVAVGAVALAAAGLAACSSTGTPSTVSSSPAASGSDPASSAAPASSSPAAASGPDVCSILTSAHVASITADLVEQATRGQVGANSACTYTLSNSSIQVQVAPASSSAGYAGFSGLVSAGANPAGSAVAVPGLGQQAISSSVGVAAQGAKYAVLVLNNHGQIPNQLRSDVEMAQVLISALG